MSFRDPFDFLGLERNGATEADVKRAYALRLKTVRPDENPKEFMELREAFEQARRAAQWSDGARRVDDVLLRPEHGIDQPAPRNDMSQAPAEDLTGQELPKEEADNAGSATPIAAAGSPLSKGPDREASQGYSDEIAMRVEHVPNAFSTDERFADELDADAAYEAAMDQINKLITGPWAVGNPDAWDKILADHSMDNLDVFARLSNRLRSLVCEHSGEDSEPQNMVKPDWLNNMVLWRLNQQFGWIGQRHRYRHVQDQNVWIARLAEFLEDIAQDELHAKVTRRPRRKIDNDALEETQRGGGLSTFGNVLVSLFWILAGVSILYQVFLG